MTFDEQKQIYKENFSLGYLGTDFNSRVALISMIAYLTQKLKEKNPKITFYQVVRKAVGDKLPDDLIERLAIICEDFAYGCDTFPTFGIEPKKMPEKIQEIVHKWTPF